MPTQIASSVHLWSSVFLFVPLGGGGGGHSVDGQCEENSEDSWFQDCVDFAIFSLSFPGCWFCHFFSFFSWMLRSLLSSVGHAPAYSYIETFCRLHLVNKCCFIGVQNCMWHWFWMCAYMDGMVSVVGLSGSCHLTILSSPECVKHLSYLDLMVLRDWTWQEDWLF